MPEISYAEKADPDSGHADEDRAPLIEATQSEQAGRYAEILWLEQKLIGPLRPHKEDHRDDPRTNDRVEAFVISKFLLRKLRLIED